MSITAAARSSIVASNVHSALPKAEYLGRFRIVEMLGEGHHATVYRAYDPVLERDVAAQGTSPGGNQIGQGAREVLGHGQGMWHDCAHPQIVPVYEAGCAGDRHFIAMALIEGCSLAQRLAESTLELHRATEIVAELAEALSYAHSQGVVHRDVKPANIRLDSQGIVYLMDFGIAYRPDSGEIPLPPGMILGTPAYVAPEQAQGGQTDVLPASDQYSLGAVLYELLSGKPPFCGPPSYVIFHTIHREPLPLQTVVPKVPRALAAICQKAMAKRPDRRYADCEAFADDLRLLAACMKRRWLTSRRRWARLGK